MDEKLRERLLKAKEQLPRSIAEGIAPKAAGKGVRMAAMYLLGASYTQIALLFAVRKATVAQAVRNHISEKLRQARPRYENRASISPEQADAYYQAVLRSSGATVTGLAREATYAKLEEEGEY